MSSYSRTVAPTLEPVTLAEQKDHARILHNYEDTAIESHIEDARDAAERYLGQSFVTQTWEMKYDCWPRPCKHNPFQAIEVPYGPLQSVSELKYVTTSGSTVVMTSTQYIVSTGPVGRVSPPYGQSWPIAQVRPDAITLTCVQGYGGPAASTDATISVEAVPKTIKRAIKIHAQYLYQNRDDDVSVPKVVQSLLDGVSFNSYQTPSPDAY
jgi:uncharacterized phiE125 gp8 family phage protein